MTAATQQLIVVGIDGSDGSHNALTWGGGQAQLTGSRLRVVGTWRWPNYVTRIPPGVDLQAETQQLVDQAVATVRAAHPQLEAEGTVVEGPPGPALLSQAHGAALLVVGAEGRAAFPGMLLGSVAEQCVRHAHCPVVVVRSLAEQ